MFTYFNNKFRPVNFMYFIKCGVNSSLHNSGCCIRSVAPWITVLSRHTVFTNRVIHHHHHVQEGLGLIPVPCILKMKLVPPSLPRSSYVSSSFWFIL